MLEILTRPKPVELGKLYDRMIQFKFARARIKKYGFRELEPSQLFETLRAASNALMSHDSEVQFQINHFLMKHSSINGLVDEKTVEQMYQMIVENARRYMNIAADEMPNAKKVDPKPSSKPKDYKGRDDKDAGCWRCGSKSHWIRDCPQPEPPTQQQTKPSSSGASTKTKASSRTSSIKMQKGTAIRQNLKQDNKGKDSTKRQKRQNSQRDDHPQKVLT